jgi:hypothetical protein
MSRWLPCFVLANQVLRVTIGHGYYLRRVLYCALALFLTGCVVFLWARQVDVLNPVRPPGSAVEIWAPVYSLDTLLPIIDLGQEKSWRLASDRSIRGALVQTYSVIHILSGWLLATPRHRRREQPPASRPITGRDRQPSALACCTRYPASCGVEGRRSPACRPSKDLYITYAPKSCALGVAACHLT